MIALIGSEGSMGLRYQTILNYLREPFVALDKAKPDSAMIIKKASACDKIIIATPTITHMEYLRAFLPLKKPILCEKPVWKNLDELIDLHAECNRNGWSYNMVMQYKEYDISQDTGRWSSYNYFRHGDDGKAWDCMQTIGLAKGPVWIKEDSPVWECTINGRSLAFNFMDRAYVIHTMKFIAGTLDQTMDEILLLHKKVQAFQEEIG